MFYGIPLEAIFGIAFIVVLLAVLYSIILRDTSGAKLYNNYMNRNSDYEGSAGIHYNCPQKSNCHPILESCAFHGKESALRYEY